VGGDQRLGLLVVEAEQLAAEHGVLAEELGREPGEGQVPPGHQQQPEGVGVGVEQVVQGPDRGGRQLVGVVDDDQAVRPEEREEPVRGPRRVGAHPGGVVGARGLAHPAGDAEGLARAAGTDQQRGRALGRVVKPGPEPTSGHVGPGQAGQVAGRDGRRRSC